MHVAGPSRRILILYKADYSQSCWEIWCEHSRICWRYPTVSALFLVYKAIMATASENGHR